MRRKIMILVGILLLTGLAVGSYWYLQIRNTEDSIPEYGIFVMKDGGSDSLASEDAACRHSI